MEKPVEICRMRVDCMQSVFPTENIRVFDHFILLCTSFLKKEVFSQRKDVDEHLQVSSRALSHDLGISRRSVLRILKRHKFHPYHISL
ncbi:hypothetical protein NQ318_016291 [Aromia moschata]|uniref:Transposase n=1 Tax=Aromia moschata TaxID=1265417 RepID=A0AAV8XWK0_9CUCU|nr:hypothetical protein NQ318_016291 [Aromia moschata]